MIVEHGEEIVVDYDTKSMVIPDGCKTIGVRGDAYSRRLHYRIKKKPDTIDFSGFVFEVVYTNALKEIGRQVLEDVTVDGDDLTMSFLIPPSLCKVSGRVYLELCARQTGGSVHWHVKPSKHRIVEYNLPEAIEESDPKYDIVDQLVDLVMMSGGSGSGGELPFMEPIGIVELDKLLEL